MDKELCNGLMGLYLMAIGVMEEHMGMGYLLIRKEKCMKEIGCMIKHRDMEHIHITMVLVMKVVGTKIFSMDKEKSNGLMDLYFKENTEMEKRTE